MNKETFLRSQRLWLCRGRIMLVKEWTTRGVEWSENVDLGRYDPEELALARINERLGVR